MAAYLQISHTLYKSFILNSWSHFHVKSLIFKKFVFFLYYVFFDADSKSEISFCRSDLVLDLFDFKISIKLPMSKNRVVSYIKLIWLILCLWTSNGPYVGYFASQTCLVGIVSLLSINFQGRVVVPLAPWTHGTIFPIRHKCELQSRIPQKIGPNDKI